MKRETTWGRTGWGEGGKEPCRNKTRHTFPSERFTAHASSWNLRKVIRLLEESRGFLPDRNCSYYIRSPKGASSRKNSRGESRIRCHCERPPHYPSLRSGQACGAGSGSKGYPGAFPGQSHSLLWNEIAPLSWTMKIPWSNPPRHDRRRFFAVLPFFLARFTPLLRDEEYPAACPAFYNSFI